MKRPISTRGLLRSKVSAPLISSEVYLLMRLGLAAIWVLPRFERRKTATAANAADITANPLVVALVVFPTGIQIVSNLADPPPPSLPFRRFHWHCP